jgi:hypothetical protein
MIMKPNELLFQRLTAYPGVFECHITVALPPQQPNKLVLFDQICQQLGGKTIVIQLANGKTPTQPMISKNFKGDANLVLSQINALHQEIAKHFPIVRLKVETSTFNAGLPETTEEAARLPPSCYFEFHVKMQLEKDHDLDQLRTLLAPYHSYVSENTLEEDESDNLWAYRFATQRFRLGKPAAEAHLSALLTFLKTQHITVKKVNREFNIFDSNADLDAGWTDENANRNSN